MSQWAKSRASASVSRPRRTRHLARERIHLGKIASESRFSPIISSEISSAFPIPELRLVPVQEVRKGVTAHGPLETAERLHNAVWGGPAPLEDVPNRIDRSLRRCCGPQVSGGFLERRA